MQLTGIFGSWTVRLVCAALITGLSPSAAWSQTMLVSEFLEHAAALEKKGMLALFSADMKRLKAEIANSGRALRAEEAAARAAGRKTDTCMPTKAAVTSDEVMAHFKAMPPEQRAIPVRQAFEGLIRQKYPCTS